jgi:nucleoside-diphosphate-sugar epimerase
MKKVLVLGASGNIGGLVLAELMQRGIAVLAIARSDAKLLEAQPRNPVLTVVQVRALCCFACKPLILQCHWPTSVVKLRRIWTSTLT